MRNKEYDWLLAEKYGGAVCQKYEHDRQRLDAGEPLAYVIGYVPFLQCQIHLDSHPLIPRPETEYWTTHVIELLKSKDSSKQYSVLDLCAGSGCVGVAIANACSNVKVTLAEIDPTHLPTIEKNVYHNCPHPQQHSVVRSDLFTDIADRYDIIVSNPPYIDPTLHRVDPSVQEHEPALALYGGSDGLEYIATIIDSAASHLHHDGILFIEHEPEQRLAINSLGQERGFKVQTHTDQYGVYRYSTLTMAQ